MCKNIIKVIFATCMLFVFSVSLTAGITSTDAKDIVLNNILGDEIERVNVYESDQILTSQNSVTLWNGETISSQYENSWFYFVDDYPMGKWHHPCRIIFLNESNGEYEIIEKTIFPMDYEKEMELISEFIKQDVIEIPTTTVITEVERALPNEHLYAVIINGSEGEEDRFWNDMSAMYCALLDKGYIKDNIYVHYYGDTHSEDLDGGDYSNDIDESATKILIEETFTKLSKELDHDDQLFVYVDGHGNNSDESFPDPLWGYIPNSYIDLKGEEDITDDELAGYVENIDCAQMIFTIGCCFSGGFATKLNEYTADTKCTNRTVHTASWNETAWAEQWISNINYHEYFYYWISAIRGYVPGIDPWIPGDPVDEFLFENKIPDHPGAKDPDSDGDGYLHMNEVFRYTNDFNTWTGNFETWPGGDEPFFGGYHNQKNTALPPEYPQNSFSSNFVTNFLSLEGICGNVEPSEDREKLSWPPEPSDLEIQTITGNLMVNPKLTIKPGVSLNYVGDNTMTFVSDPSKISYEDGLVIETLSKFVIEDAHLVFEEGAQLTMLEWSFFEAKGNTSIIGNVVTNDRTLMTIPSNSELILNAGSNLTIADGAILNLDGNLIVENGANLIFEPNSNIKVFGNLILKSNEILNSGTHLELFSGANLIIEGDANLFLESGAIIDVIGDANIMGNVIVGNDVLVDVKENSTLNLGFADLNIADGATLKLQAGSKLINLNGSHLVFDYGSTVEVSENTEIVIMNKSYFTAIGTNFSYVDISGKWLGINAIGGSSIEMNNVNIIGAETGVKGTGNYEFDITNSNFEGCINGIDLLGMALGREYTIENNIVTGVDDGRGIMITGA
ncbi:MAG: hypothetical protein GQ534_07360, partial [Candidatus Delongbacteria bacterium]|nr:hypothetical protein [Candidatus Delongbacteria bacterium]